MERFIPSRAEYKTTEPYKAPIVPFRSIFNAAAPAMRLPAELVAKILTSGAWIKWQELFILTHICRHWRNIARGTPQLWADAVDSVFKYEGDLHRVHCLPMLFEWSASYPLRLHAERSQPVLQLTHYAMLEPHLSRISHLAVNVRGVEEVVEVLDVVRSLRSLESLHIPSFCNEPFYVDEIPFWTDADLPFLHTVSMTGRFFTSRIAVKSLKTLVLHHGGYRHDVFLAALDRCALGLETLTVSSWSQERREGEIDAPNATPRTVHLPALSHFNIHLADPTDTPTSLFAALSFPPDVTIELSRGLCRGSTHHLLPKNMIGLHAPPFFDAIYLCLFQRSGSVTLHCYAGGVQRLCVSECAMGPGIQDFLNEHRYANVTELALDLEHAPSMNKDLLRQFVQGLSNLCRLELLGGPTAEDLKLQVAESFLDLLRQRPTTPSAQETCLAYVCAIESRWDSEPDDYGIIADHRAQLDRLQAVLSHGCHRLGRLELCITSYTPPIPSVMGAPEASMSSSIFGRLKRRHLSDVPAHSFATEILSRLYLPCFLRSADEVVFVGKGLNVGNVNRHVALGGGAIRQPVPGAKRLNQGRDVGTARKRRQARKGR